VTREREKEKNGVMIVGSVVEVVVVLWYK